MGLREQYIAEMRLKPLLRENRSKIHKKWRYDLEIYKLADGANGGVLDRRIHIGGGTFGYAHTRWGALRQIAKAYAKAHATYDMA